MIFADDVPQIDLLLVLSGGLETFSHIQHCLKEEGMCGREFSISNYVVMMFDSGYPLTVLRKVQLNFSQS